jgi:hypothetical protein
MPHAAALQSPPQPDLNAYLEVQQLPPDVLLKQLNQELGTRLLAYVGRFDSKTAVFTWVDAASMNPDDPTTRRLRWALRVCRFLDSYESRPVIQAWFQGANRLLDDASPARMLRNARPQSLDRAGERVQDAAKAFVALG